MQKDKNEIRIYTPEELRDHARNAPPDRWIVDGSLRAGRRRPSLFAGKTGGGKSTISRQVAVCVAKGEPFLGRATERCEVLYWQTEEGGRDVWEDLERMGYNLDQDEKIITFAGPPSQNKMQNVAEILGRFPKIGLLIVETADDLFKLSDSNNNSEARSKFDMFEEIVMDKFGDRVAVLLLHQMRKREVQHAADAVMGATNFTARTDCKWYLKKKSDSDKRRVFFTEVRKGRDIPETYLTYDEKTGKSTLGMPLEEERTLNIGKTKERIEEEITQWFATHPGSSFEVDCLATIHGNSDTARKVFKDMRRKGLVVRGGRGTKTSPFVYSMAEIPMEVKEDEAA